MNITSSHIVYVGGYPTIDAIIDGIKTRIPYEQKALEYGLVYLGLAFEGIVQATLPASRKDGRREAQKLDGFTDDAAIMGLYRVFREHVDDTSA